MKYIHRDSYKIVSSQKWQYCVTVLKYAYVLTSIHFQINGWHTPVR